jgi:hypothetical protein
LDPGAKDRAEFARITSATNPSRAAFTSTMDKAMYIIHKLTGEFDQEGPLLHARLGDRLSEYAWQKWMEYNGVRDPLTYHPPPARRETIGYQYRPIIVDKLPTAERETESTSSATEVDFTDDANDYQLTAYFDEADQAALPEEA